MHRLELLATRRYFWIDYCCVDLHAPAPAPQLQKLALPVFMSCCSWVISIEDDQARGAGGGA